MLLFPDELRTSGDLSIFPFDYILQDEEFSSRSRYDHFSHHIPRHRRKSYSYLCIGHQNWLAEQEVHTRVLHKRQTGFLRNYKDDAYFLTSDIVSMGLVAKSLALSPSHSIRM